MRGDVLELMADEVAARAADPLASFISWEDGRRKLDGMSRGRRWDIDREQREFEREGEKLFASLRWRRWYAKNADAFAAYRKAWAAANRSKERGYSKRKHARRKKDPKRWAVHLARAERHRAKKSARAKARYQANLEAARARGRAHARNSYARHYKPEGKRKCSLCRLPGHNSRRCHAVG